MQLPARFMDKKISIEAESTQSCVAFDIDQFMMSLETYRKELVFNEFSYTSLIPPDKSSHHDCINGLLLLFSRCEQVQLTNISCKSDTVFKAANPFKTQAETALFDKCKLEHPDLEPDKRITLENLRLNWKYTSKLFNFEQLRELCLTQSSYQHNLETFGLELVNLKELCINHYGEEDLSILSSLHFLPETVTLDFFEIYDTEGSHGKSYSISELIEEWSPVKSKFTQVELDAKYDVDIVSKIMNRKVSLVSTKAGASQELKEKMKRLEALEFDTLLTKIVLLDT